jgi:hypothetical protein
MPVMLPRETDDEMRCDGSDAASPQHGHPVDERGRLHGVPAPPSRSDQVLWSGIPHVLLPWGSDDGAKDDTAKNPKYASGPCTSVRP